MNVNDTTISFSWNANGTTPTTPNNIFDLVIFDANDNELLRKTVTSTSYTLSIAEWNTIYHSSATSFYTIVIAYQTATPLTGGYYSTSINFEKPDHTHSYDSCVYMNNLSHKTVCVCGAVGSIGAHYVVGGPAPGETTAPCGGCGYDMDLSDDGGLGIMSITQVSINGSYILPNGIVVLVEEDIEAYLAGTLQFYHPEDVPVTQ